MRTILLLASVVTAAASSASLGVPTTPVTVLERKGSITGWSIAANGSVYIRLSDLQKGKAATATWFVTPASRTATTQLEDLVLEAVLRLRATEDRLNTPGHVAAVLTLRGDVSNERSGDTVEQAIPLVSIGQP